MGELIAKVILGIVNFFVQDAAKRAEWERKVREQIRGLDSSSGESARAHSEYDEAQSRLKERQNGKPNP